MPRADVLPVAIAKAAARCQNTINKSGVTFIAKKLKSLAVCHNATFKCIEASPTQAECLAKARTKCSLELVRILAADRRLRPPLTRRCAFDTLGVDTLLSPDGLGFESASSSCASDLGAPLTSVSGVADCVFRQRVCAADELFEASAPRARELLRILDVPAPTLAAVACLSDNGGDGASLADILGTGRAVARCGAALVTAASTFATRKLRTLTQCLDRSFACVQLSPGDPECLRSAALACAASTRQVAIQEGRLAEALARRCGADVVSYVLLRSVAGLHLDGMAADCAEVGVSTLASLADYERCLVRRQTCGVERLVLVHAPRAEELLALIGQSLHSAFCPVVSSPGATTTPTAIPTASQTGTPSRTPTPTPDPSSPPSVTVSGTPTLAATPTDSGTPPATPSVPDSATPSTTATEPAATAEPSGTPAAPTATPDASTSAPTDTPTRTSTATKSSTSTPTLTPTATGTATATRTPSPTPTLTVTPTPTRTATPTRTRTPTPTPTSTPFCGNGITEGNEECDGADLDDSDCFDLCLDQEEPGGTLRCNRNCTYNFSRCLGNDCEP